MEPASKAIENAAEEQLRIKNHVWLLEKAKPFCLHQTDFNKLYNEAECIKTHMQAN